MKKTIGIIIMAVVAMVAVEVKAEPEVTLPATQRTEVIAQWEALRYIPASDHSVPDNVPVENYDCFVDLVRKYGTYPLDLEEYDIPELGG